MPRRAPQDAEAPERAWIAAAKADPAAFAPLYEAHFHRVYAYVARRVPDRAEVEDLTAEVFRKALAGIGGFEWQGKPFIAWLLRIASNAVADRARRALRSLDGGAAGGAEAIADEAVWVDPVVREQSELYRHVAALPRDQRRVVELRFGEEWSVREIAREMGRSEGAVKQLQLRALRTLRRTMRGDDGQTQPE